MQSFGQRQLSGPAVFGFALILVGIVAMLGRQAGINIFESVGEHGWPFFIIVPGVILLALALVPAPPMGEGFAIAGAVVTTVGGILLYQTQTDHWESWSYAWALIPAAVGASLVLYGLYAGQRELLEKGLWMAAIAGAAFLAGAWFFEGIFAGDRQIIDAGSWWPVAVIVLGALILARAFFFPTRREPPASS